MDSESNNTMKLLQLEAKLTVLLEWITEYFGIIPDSLVLKLNSIELKYQESDSISIKEETDADLEQNDFVNSGILDVDEATLDFDAADVSHKSDQDAFSQTTSTSNNSLVQTGQVKLVDIRTITNSQESAEHTCTHCSASFSSIRELSVHSLIHCKVRMSHVSSKKEKKSIKPSFVYNRKKLNEMRKKAIDREFKCHVCPNSFNSHRGLQTHMKIAHRQNLSKYKCDKCDIDVKDKMVLERHMLKEHPESCPDFACPDCSKTYKSLLYLNNHRKRVHTDSDLVFPCEICGKKFKNRRYAIDHAKKAHADPNDACPCDTCGKSFKTSQNLRVHKKICQVEKSFLCQECGFAVNTDSALRGHIERMHSKVRPFLKCPHCPNEFSTQEGLRNHISRHFDKHLKRCPYCGVMKDTTNLYNHVNIVHKGRKFKCRDCDAMFSHKAHLKNHYVLKHPDLETPKEFAVVYVKNDELLNPEVPATPSTGVKTTTKSFKTVKRHRIDKIRELVCSTCDAVFVTHNDMELHLIRHEKDTEYRMKRRVPVKRLQMEEPNTML